MNDCNIPFESIPLITYKTDPNAHTYTSCVHPIEKYHADTANGLLYDDIETMVSPYIPPNYMEEERNSDDASHMFVFVHNEMTKAYISFLMKNHMISTEPQYNIYRMEVPDYYDISLLFVTKSDRDAFVDNLGAFSSNIQ